MDLSVEQVASYFFLPILIFPSLFDMIFEVRYAMVSFHHRGNNTNTRWPLV